MKILYLTQDHDAAERAAGVLHETARNVTLVQALSPGSALEWLHENADAAAILVAAAPESTAAFVERALPGIVEQATARDRSRRHELARALSVVEADAATRIAEVEARHAASVSREARICTMLQQRVFELEHEVRAAEERRAADAGAFADQSARRHAEFTASLTHTLHSRDALAAELAAREAALEDAHNARLADAAAAAEQLRRHEAEVAALRAEASATRASLEEALDETEHAARDARERADFELAVATDLQAALEDLLAHEVRRRRSVEQRLAAAETAFSEERQQRGIEQACARDQYAALDTQLALARTELGRERDDNDALRRTLAATHEELHRVERGADEERHAHERDRAALSAELQRVGEEYAQLRHSFDRLQSAFQMLDEIAADHAAERARLESVVAERESELHAQARRHRIAEQEAHDAFAEAEAGLRTALDASNAQVAQLQREGAALRRDLETARSRGEALRREAERVPELQSQLEASQRERRREFERAPYALCRCTPDGTITDANHWFVALLGRRRADDVRNSDFKSAVFDCAGDLGWLLERSRIMRTTESVETSWKTRDGRDLFVRLHASAGDGSVDIVVEDITKVRALEERLRQAQRIEAVGRLASEVAVTCDALLGDVASGVQTWMAAGAGDARRHGERLLTDVTRAAKHLRQLGAYGHQEVRALSPVSARNVLRDLAPVLQRVVGDDVTLMLAKASGSFDVDVDRERLERVLVNVAGYARERMPAGGQMRIDLAATALGRRFVSRYPNVRPGHHVLITVTELPRTDSRDFGQRGPQSFGRPGVDLGALVDID
jgi:hypothetical protein